MNKHMILLLFLILIPMTSFAAESVDDIQRAAFDPEMAKKFGHPHFDPAVYRTAMQKIIDSCTANQKVKCKTYVVPFIIQRQAELEGKKIVPSLFAKKEKIAKEYATLDQTRTLWLLYYKNMITGVQRWAIANALTVIEDENSTGYSRLDEIAYDSYFRGISSFNIVSYKDYFKKYCKHYTSNNSNYQALMAEELECHKAFLALIEAPENIKYSDGIIRIVFDQKMANAVGHPQFTATLYATAVQKAIAFYSWDKSELKKSILPFILQRMNDIQSKKVIPTQLSTTTVKIVKEYDSFKNDLFCMYKDCLINSIHWLSLFVATQSINKQMVCSSLLSYLLSLYSFERVSAENFMKKFNARYPHKPYISMAYLAEELECHQAMLAELMPQPALPEPIHNESSQLIHRKAFAHKDKE